MITHDVAGDLGEAHSHRPVYTYDEQYDAYYCADCNVWLEAACEDPTCKYCKDRPEVHA